MSDKIKYEIEFQVKASPAMLFPFLSTPSGLSDWFCDDVNSRGEIYTFVWEGVEEVAKMITKKRDSKIRFKWKESEDDNSYFEFNAPSFRKPIAKGEFK
mgnify:CR=1 FL=1